MVGFVDASLQRHEVAAHTTEPASTSTWKS
jgi:hypothetical protein